MEQSPEPASQVRGPRGPAAPRCAADLRRRLPLSSAEMLRSALFARVAGYTTGNRISAIPLGLRGGHLPPVQLGPAA